MGKTRRAEAGLLAVGIPTQIEPCFPVHKLGRVCLDKDELQEVEVRVPTVVGSLSPVSRLIAANLADVAHFLENFLDLAITQEALKGLALTL